MGETQNVQASEMEALLGSYLQERESLIPILQAVQERFGFISEESVKRISVSIRS